MGSTIYISIETKYLRVQNDNSFNGSRIYISSSYCEVEDVVNKCTSK